MSNIYTRRLIRFYANIKGRFYRRTDGTFIRAVPTGQSSNSVLRCTDAQGNVIPRIRMSKKLRRLMRRAVREGALDALPMGTGKTATLPTP